MCHNNASVELTSFIQLCHECVNGCGCVGRNGVSLNRPGKCQAEQTLGRHPIKSDGSSTFQVAPYAEEAACQPGLQVSGNRQPCPQSCLQNLPARLHRSHYGIQTTHQGKISFNQNKERTPHQFCPLRLPCCMDKPAARGPPQARAAASATPPKKHDSSALFSHRDPPGPRPPGLPGCGSTKVGQEAERRTC